MTVEKKLPGERGATTKDFTLDLFPESMEQWNRIIRESAIPLTEKDAREMDEEGIDEIRGRAATLKFSGELGAGKSLNEAAAESEKVRHAQIPDPGIYMKRFRRATEK
jgi:hypothetical protein